MKEILHGSVVLEKKPDLKSPDTLLHWRWKPNFLRSLSVSTKYICVKYYAFSFNILTVRTRFKGRVPRRKSFHNSSHQASERNFVFYRTYRPPYHISHNLKSLNCIWQDYGLFYLPTFISCTVCYQDVLN